ncbi:MAG: right-handed parallel beta-helix repeat-containing protein [Candidatus Thermoplasmatota archaeon]|nr:right-handed parallel beta-helix repeat-containing protein [Candidatus Thermoplasmatota archaeon]
MKTFVLIIFIMILFSIIFPVDIGAENASENIHYVGGNKDGNYTSIQEAINNASAGDTIFVYNGIYSESIVIYKKINLVAEKGAVLDFNKTNDIVSLTADGSRINGFIIRNCSGGVYFGIKVEKSNNIVIENNVFVNNSANSIYLYYSSNIKILNNTFYDDGIFIVGEKSDWGSHTILNNTVDNLPIFYYKNKTNLSISKLDCGQIILANCSRSIVKNNNVSKSNIGVFLGFSNNNSIIKNNITNNIFGIRLQYSDDNGIENNSIKENDYGVFIQHSQRNTIKENNISYSNVDGCHFCCDSKDNIIFMNNFLFNTENAYDLFRNIWYKEDLGNYWDDYSGFDKNGDLIGDSAYNISSTSSDLYPLIIPFQDYIENIIDDNTKVNGLKNDNCVILAIFSIAMVVILIILLFYFKVKK